MQPILVIDNYDSFTFNLVHMLQALGCEVAVFRNDRIILEEVSRYDRIVLSPGPGIPSEAGIMPSLVATLAPTKAILGVCLGHQCIGEQFGGKLTNLAAPSHGKALPTVVCADDSLFHGLPATFLSGRYHSWVVANEDFPPALEVTARDESGTIMALRHRTYNVRGVQFHPESVLTEHGERLLRNWLENS